MAERPKPNPDEVDRKRGRAGKEKDVKTPIARKESIDDLAARREANRKKTIRDIK